MAPKNLPEATTPQDREAAVGNVNLTSVIEQLAIMVNMDPKAYDALAREVTTRTAKKKLSEEEYAYFMAQCQSLDLNPVRGEIAAFPKDGKVILIISNRGWVKIAKKHDDFDGYDSELHFAANGQLDYIIGIVYLKHTSHPVRFPVFMTDFYRAESNAWVKYRNTMLANKAQSHGYMHTFGFAECMDFDDLERLVGLNDASAPKSLPEMEVAPPETAPTPPTPPPVASLPPQPGPTGTTTQLSQRQRWYLGGLWKEHTGIVDKEKRDEAWLVFFRDKGILSPGYDDLKPLLDKWATTDQNRKPKPPEDISEIIAFLECHPEFKPAAGEGVGASPPAPPDGGLILVTGIPCPNEMPEALEDRGELLAIIDASVMEAAKAKKLKRPDVVKIAGDRFGCGLPNLDLKQWKIIWLHILTLKG